MTVNVITVGSLHVLGGLDWIWLGWIGLNWIGLLGLDWIGLDWIGWTGLVWTGPQMKFRSEKVPLMSVGADEVALMRSC